MYAATGGRFAGRHRVRLNTNCLLGRLKSLTEKEDHPVFSISCFSLADLGGQRIVALT
jgi:hypothetical protein